MKSRTTVMRELKAVQAELDSMGVDKHSDECGELYAVVAALQWVLRHRRKSDCPHCGGRGKVWYFFWRVQCPVCEGEPGIFQRAGCKAVGVTTTPLRLSNKELRGRFDKTPTGPNITELIKRGYLGRHRRRD